MVLPWALQGFRPSGDVLEIGAGSGAMAAGLMAGYRDIRVTATDFDDAMVAEAAARLAPFGDRVTTQQADATALPFADASFDAVLSCLMLHHTVEWETALAEAVRVLRPSGRLVGFDLVARPALRALHQHDGHLLRMMRLPELRAAVGDLGLATADVTRGLGGYLVRFSLQKA